jgi:hypothetical protein
VEDTRLLSGLGSLEVFLREPSGNATDDNSSNYAQTILRSYNRLSIFRVEPGSGQAAKNFCYFGPKKILPMTIPLDASGLNFRVGLGRVRTWAGHPHIL